jgi:hypothetical protein
MLRNPRERPCPRDLPLHGRHHLHAIADVVVFRLVFGVRHVLRCQKPLLAGRFAGVTEPILVRQYRHLSKIISSVRLSSVFLTSVTLIEAAGSEMSRVLSISSVVLDGR